MSEHHRRTRWASKSAKARALMKPAVEQGAAVCARCHRPILPGQEWDAGHVIDLAIQQQLGIRDDRVHIEHRNKRDCPEGGNRAAGGRAGATKTNHQRTERRREDNRLPDY